MLVANISTVVTQSQRVGYVQELILTVVLGIIAIALLVYLNHQFKEITSPLYIPTNTKRKVASTAIVVVNVLIVLYIGIEFYQTLLWITF